MAIDNVDRRLEQARRPGFGIGLLKGMRVLLKHLVKHNSVIQYPDVKQDLASRTRGVIALKEENCTVCMLCARECPDWCIYIDSHKETLPPKREGGRPRKRNVLDRFAIDYALCMYCGICVEVCPYDALFWSREFEYSEYDIRQLTHEKERLSDWMATVLPPPELEFGAELPGQPAAAATAPAPAPTQPATAARPATTTSSAAETRPQQVVEAPKVGTAAPTDSKPATATPDAATAPAPETAKPTDASPERALTEETKAEQMDSGATVEAEPAKKVDEAGKVTAEGSQAEVEAAPAPVRPAPKLEDLEDPEAAYKRVLDAQSKAQSSPQVAQARAKVARVKAERAIAQATAAATTSEPHAEPKPSGAPEAKEPAPEQGPVAPTAEEQDEASTPEPTAEQPKAEASSEDPDAVFERVLEEERAKGSSDAVANARAKAARMRAIKGSKGPGS